MNAISVAGEKSNSCLEGAIFPATDIYFNLRSIYNHCLEGVIVGWPTDPEECKKRRHESYLRNREKHLTGVKKYAEQHKEEIKNYMHDYNLENNERLIVQKREYYQNIGKQKTKELMRQRRIECLTHYSDGTLKCACCGEAHIEFLCIDHINGKGNEHRRSIGGRNSGHMYNWLIKNNFPPGFRVLCHNCNMARGFYGYCPHEKLNEGVK